MAKDDVLELEGTVVEALPNATFSRSSSHSDSFKYTIVALTLCVFKYPETTSSIDSRTPEILIPLSDVEIKFSLSESILIPTEFSVCSKPFVNEGNDGISDITLSNSSLVTRPSRL